MIFKNVELYRSMRKKKANILIKNKRLLSNQKNNRFKILAYQTICRAYFNHNKLYKLYRKKNHPLNALFLNTYKC